MIGLEGFMNEFTILYDMLDFAVGHEARLTVAHAISYLSDRESYLERHGFESRLEEVRR
jgi:hypothetical protein